MDEDHASQRNGVGYNGCDTYIGNSLASQPTISRKQAVLGRKLVGKYWKQLPAGLYKAATGKNSKIKTEEEAA